MSLDLSKPLQLSDGTPVELMKMTGWGTYQVTPVDSYSTWVGSFHYKHGDGMEISLTDLKHRCSDLTLENVKVGLDLTKPIQTRDGRHAVHLPHRDVIDKGRYINADVLSPNKTWTNHTYWPNGRIHNSDRQHADDLVNVPQVITYGDTLSNSGVGVNVTETDGVITKLELV